jgi:hypothetical protein
MEEFLLDKTLLGNLSKLYDDPLAPLGLANLRRTESRLFRWCEYLAYQNGIFASAINRLASYFITRVEIKNIPDEIRNKLEYVLEQEIDIYEKLREIAFNYMVYGNCFISVFPPFRRFLRCQHQKCSAMYAIDEILNNKTDYRFRFENYEFKFHCYNCDKDTVGEVVDVADERSYNKISIKLWNIHEILIQWDPFLQNNRYVWRIPGYVKTAVQQGDPGTLSSISLSVLRAIKEDKYFLFEPNSILHLRTPNLCGIIDRGWGVPLMVSLFPHLFFVQLMHRYNEALAMDYVIPTRVISPAAQTTAAAGELGEPLQPFSRSFFKMLMERELSKQKLDPTRILISPIPIQYQLLGGEAKSLAPVELLSFGVDVLLSSIGLPVELYKGTMQVQAMPVALRLMEASLGYIPKMLNRALRFIVESICAFMKWPTPIVNLEKVTLADDLQRQLAKLQLMAQGLISQTTGLKALGIDMKEEFLRMLEDEQFKSMVVQKMQQKMQQTGTISQMVQAATSQVLQEALTGAQPQPAMPAPGGGQAAQAGGAPASGGGAAPPQGGMAVTPGASPQQITLAALLSGQVPVAMLQRLTPEEMEQIARQIAQELFNKPESIRLSEMRKLKQIHPLIHARVLTIMEEMRSQLRLAGGELIRQLQSSLTGMM